MKKFFIIFIALVITSCASKFATEMKNAESLETSGQIEKAYSLYSQLCEENIGSNACDEKKRLSSSVLELKLSEIDKIYSKSRINKLIPLNAIDEVENIAKEIKILGFINKSNLVIAKADEERKNTINEVERLLNEGKKKENENKIINAALDYSFAIILDETQKSKDKSNIIKKAVKILEEDIVIDKNKYEWSIVKSNLFIIKKIDNTYPNLEELIKEATSNDTYEYYMTKGEELENEKNKETALLLYGKAYKIQKSKDLKSKINNIRITYIEDLYNEGLESIDEEMYFSAYIAIEKANELHKKLPRKLKGDVIKPMNKINDFVQLLLEDASEADDSGEFGKAYQFYKFASQITNLPRSVKNKIQKINDKMFLKATKGLAIVPFKSPQDSPEAGKKVNSSITLYIHKNMSNDIRVVEREAIENIMKEYEVKMASGDDLSTGINLQGADYLLIGEVTDYKVEKQKQVTTKTQRVQTRTDYIVNPAYTKWKKLSKRKQKKKEMPKEKLAKPFKEKIQYNEIHYKNTGILSLSYRIVDTRGKVIFTDVLNIKNEVIDVSTDGVEYEEFKVPTKIAKLPSDSELLKSAQDKLIVKMAISIKEILGDSEVKYMNSAKENEAEDKYIDALNYYSLAEIIYNNKNINTDDLKVSIGKIIDSLTME